MSSTHAFAGLLWFAGGIALGALSVYFARIDAAHAPGGKYARLVYSLRVVVGVLLIFLIAGYGLAQSRQLDCQRGAIIANAEASRIETAATRKFITDLRTNGRVITQEQRDRAFDEFLAAGHHADDLRAKYPLSTTVATCGGTG